MGGEGGARERGRGVKHSVLWVEGGAPATCRGVHGHDTIRAMHTATELQNMNKQKYSTPWAPHQQFSAKRAASMKKGMPCCLASWDTW